MPIGSVWTTAARANEWARGVDLVADPTALNQSLSDAQADIYERLIVFICKTTVDGWTDLTNTPEKVQYWTARMTAAIYLSKYQGYHLQPEIPDNPAAVFYADVLKEIDQAQRTAIDITDQAGNVVPVDGIGVTGPERADYTMYRYAEWLPVSQGGDIED